MSNMEALDQATLGKLAALKEKLADVINIQKPAPLPAEVPFGTPSPEDALIEILDNNKLDEESK
jgi:hypothetical protein